MTRFVRQFRERIHGSLLAQALAVNFLPVAVSAFCVLLMAAAFLLVQKRGFENEARLRAQSLAKVVAEQSVLSALVGDTAELERVARSAAAADDVLYVRISAEGLEEVAAAPAGQDRSASPPPGGVLEAVQEIPGASGRQVVDWDNPPSQGSLGEVRVGLSTARQAAMLTRVAFAGLLVSAGLLAVILWVQQRRLRKVLYPLKSLIEFTRHVSGGDLSREAPVVRSDEVGELATACNEMVRTLRQSRKELVHSLEAARESSRLKSEFLANMSHEIRTPLNGVIGMTELALETELTGEQREYLSTAADSAHSLLRVLNDILDLSKIEAGRLDLESVAFDLEALLAQTVKSFSVAAGSKGLELAYSVGEDVPRWVTGDPSRLRQVIANLLANAVKFTQAGEVVLEVRREPDHRLHFTVRDTGIGIPKDKQEVIFEAFRQADGSTTRKYGGTGLGLAICSRLVTLMGGDFWVDSVVGQGSQFQFRIQCGEARPRTGPAPLRLENLRTLVVDDNATNRRIVREYALGWGMLVNEASGAAEALDRLVEARRRGEPYRLLILDAMMPQVDGFELARKVKADPGLADTIVLMLSSATLRADLITCRAAGLDHYVIKPVTRDELRQAVLEALHLAGEPQGVPASPPSAAAGPSTRLTVLLAEDNAVNQRLAQRLVEREGHRVEVAASGIAALAAMEQTAFDLVLMDLQMPEMDGFQATRAIRQMDARLGRHTPIVAITAHAMEADRQRCLDAGMDGYLSKPLSISDLRALIRSVQQAAAARPAVPSQ